MKKTTILASLLLFLPLSAIASFIESTIGAAVINDATATVYNPAALIVVKQPQFIELNSYAIFQTRFNGSVTTRSSNFTQFGSTSTSTNYFLPSAYFALPINSHLTVGAALVANFFNRDVEQNSVLRYVQANNNVQDIDLVTSLGFKLTDELSIGAGITFSHAEFLLKPIAGLPAMNVPDLQSRNSSSGNAKGIDLGVLYKLSSQTMMGLNYRSGLHYNLRGKSVLQGTPPLIASDYRHPFWTPARTVFSVNHFLNSQLGFISTIQYIEWNVFKVMNIYNIATEIGRNRIIVKHAQAPYHFRNTWLLTLGLHYRVNPNWIVRAAGTYGQSPSNPKYQVGPGDSMIIGASMGYTLNKVITLDGSYAHAFIKSQKINIRTPRNLILGNNKASRDAVSLKLTINI